MPEEKKNASFYGKHGFKVMPDAVVMQSEVNEGVLSHCKAKFL